MQQAVMVSLEVWHLSYAATISLSVAFAATICCKDWVMRHGPHGIVAQWLKQIFVKKLQGSNVKLCELLSSKGHFISLSLSLSLSLSFCLSENSIYI
jgi:hypothetical protein